MQRKIGFSGAIISFLLTIIVIIVYYNHEETMGHLAPGQGFYPLFILFAIFIIFIIGSILSICFFITALATYNKPLKNIPINNNIFSPIGRIEQLCFIYTGLCIIFLTIIVSFINRFLINYGLSTISQLLNLALFIILLCAISKRLRDVNWTQLYLIFTFIPFINIILWLTLCFIKSKYNTETQSKLKEKTKLYRKDGTQ